MIEDSTVVEPQGHLVVFENDRVRVIETRASEGATMNMHSHPARVIVSLGSYRYKSTDPDGNVTIADMRPGMVVWSDGQAHAVEVLAGSAHAVEIEVK